MFPNHILKIINKYKSTHTVELINNNIEGLIAELKEVNTNISEKLYILMDGECVDEYEQQLHNDSITLRNYISTIKLISQNDNKLQYESKTELLEDSSLHENIIINVVDENICPKCNVKLKSDLIQYYRKNVQEKIWWYKCPCCNNIYCIDNEIEDFYFDDTNIILNYLINTLKQSVDLVFTDIIVLSSVNICSYKTHDLNDVIANIPTITNDGSIEFIPICVSYCEQCNKYIMLKSDFKNIENVIACQVIDQTVVRDKSNSDDIEIKQYESVLYQYGYNVKSKENLSDRQRHIILASVIESNILTRGQVCSHLDTLIERGRKIDKWKYATQKWKQDREYVKKYNSQSLPRILVDKVIAKYSQIRMG